MYVGGGGVLPFQIHLCNRVMSKAKSSYYDKIIQEIRLTNNPCGMRLTKSCIEFNLNAFRNVHLLGGWVICLAPSLLIRSHRFLSLFSLSPIRVTPGLQISDETILTTFHPASEEETRRLNLTTPSKSCELDPIPAHLLKSCVGVLVMPITLLVNKSLAEGFSHQFSRMTMSSLY